MNWFGQSTTTLSSRHMVKTARLRIAQISPGLSIASGLAPGLRRLLHRHLRHDHGLWTESAAPGTGTSIYACSWRRRGQSSRHSQAVWASTPPSSCPCTQEQNRATPLALPMVTKRGVPGPPPRQAEPGQEGRRLSLWTARVPDNASTSHTS